MERIKEAVMISWGPRVAYLLILLPFLSGCRDLSSSQEVRKVLSQNVENCGIDQKSMHWFVSARKEELKEYRQSFIQKFQEVKDIMLRHNIRWEFKMDDSIIKTCQLKKSIIMASPGVMAFVDSIHWGLKSLVIKENLPISVQKLRLIVSPKVGQELYELNRNARAYLGEKNESTIDFYINLGDNTSGVSFASLLRNFTQRDLVFKSPQLRQQPAGPRRVR